MCQCRDWIVYLPLHVSQRMCPNAFAGLLQITERQHYLIQLRIGSQWNEDLVDAQYYAASYD